MRLLQVLLLTIITQYNFVGANGGVTRTPRDGAVITSNCGPVLSSDFPITAGPSRRSSLNDSSSAIDCNASWVTWLIDSVNYDVGSYMTFTSTRTYHNMTAKTEVLCDGHTRIIGGINGLITTATGTTTFLTSAVLTPSVHFKPPAPACIPAPSDRTSIFLRFKVWVPMTNPFVSVQVDSTTLSSSIAGHGRICGHCNLYGGTVQLLYFPITRDVSHIQCPTNSPGSPTLCPLASTLHSYHVTNPYEMSPCAYVIPKATSTRNSGPYFVSQGQSFYQNRAYISLQTVYAKDDCSFVGNARPGTILEVMSSDVYTVAGYHHQFKDVGYQVNFEDFSSVPAAAYYFGCNVSSASATLCSYTGSRYRYSTDFINGLNTIDFGNAYQPYSARNQWIWDEAYAPRLLVPLQMRQLDPAWSTCSWNLNGLYDPPQVLSAELTYPTPTYPSTVNTATARPASPSLRTLAPVTTRPHKSSPATSNISGNPPPSPSHNPEDTSSASLAAASSGSHSSRSSNPVVQDHEVVTFTYDHHLHTIAAVPTTTGVYIVDGEYIITEGAPAVTVEGMRLYIGHEDILSFGSKSIALSADASGMAKSDHPEPSMTSKHPPLAPTSSPASSLRSGSAAPNTSGSSIRIGWASDGLLVWFVALLAALVSQ